MFSLKVCGITEISHTYVCTSGCSKPHSERNCSFKKALRGPWTCGLLIDFQGKVLPSTSLVKTCSLVGLWQEAANLDMNSNSIRECCVSKHVGRLCSNPFFLSLVERWPFCITVCLHSSWHEVWLHALSTVANPGCSRLRFSAYSDFLWTLSASVL